MIVLYYSLPHEKQDNGGNMIRKRNLAMLTELEDKSNVIVYVRPEFAKTRRIAQIFQELTGAELLIDRDLLREMKKADVIFIDATNGGSFSALALRRSRVISFFHNVEYDYFCQENSDCHGIISSLKLIIRKMALFCYEKRLCQYSDMIITLNERDSDRLRQLYGRKSDLILPTSMEDVYKEATPDDLSPYLLFVGSDFFGNTDGLFRFCEHCMPSIRAPLIVVGNGMEKYKDRYPKEQISFLGYVDDLSQLYRNASAVVLPIISGSGMKTKTCEAMMYGKVIFGTPESFEGYRLTDDCILCNNETEFIEKINAYLQKGENRFSTANRELFITNYEISVVAKKFSDFYYGETV